MPSIKGYSDEVKGTPAPSIPPSEPTQYRVTSHLIERVAELNHRLTKASSQITSINDRAFGPKEDTVSSHVPLDEEFDCSFHELQRYLDFTFSYITRIEDEINRLEQL
ncbi:MAG: hypothetical protein CL484_03180 [Acidobacteria bacterium]|nr:hypothetical protein [Acidobacteriota bacterium]